jgi:formylglycine-generating enzyme required for sulfatase activity
MERMLGWEAQPDGGPRASFHLRHGTIQFEARAGRPDKRICEKFGEKAMHAPQKFLALSLTVAFISGCASPGAVPTSIPTSRQPSQTVVKPPTEAELKPTPSVKSAPDSRSLGDTWIRLADNAVMVYAPRGEFVMGSTDDQIKYSVQLCEEDGVRIFGDGAICFPTEFADETPAHAVILQGFWIDRTEVTNKQYERCVEAGVCTPPVEKDSFTRDAYYGESAYDDYPVIWVGWEQAAAYCSWVGARLPTEAEWEYAARGPEGRIFPWGNTFDGTRLNYCDASCELGIADEVFDDGYPDTAPVGSYPSGASWCGALDMAGNVREWVTDWYGAYQGRQQENPGGPQSGQLLVSRGGSWFDLPTNVRSVKRGQNTPDFSAYKLGIRCVKD